MIVWFGQTQALTKNIWHMAICQHQFYLDRRPDSFSKSHHHHLKVPQQQQQPPPRNLNDIALDLSKSSTSLSLSTASNCSSAHSHSNLSHCGSTQTLNKMGHTPRKHPSIAASMPCHPLPLDGRSRPPLPALPSSAGAGYFDTVSPEFPLPCRLPPLDGRLGL